MKQKMQIANNVYKQYGHNAPINNKVVANKGARKLVSTSLEMSAGQQAGSKLQLQNHRKTADQLSSYDQFYSLNSHQKKKPM